MQNASQHNFRISKMSKITTPLDEWHALFPRAHQHHRPSIIGMIHVRALPGTPSFGGDAESVVRIAIEEAALYHRVGVDGILIENMHDAPYLKGDSVGPEISCWMTRIGRAVRETVGPSVPVGLQMLAGANRQALAAAHAAGLDFVRVEGYVYGHVADEGWIESCAGDLLRYRKLIGAEHVKVWADIKKKHSAHAVTADVNIVETAKAAELFRADAVILTGRATGCAVDKKEMNLVLRRMEPGETATRTFHLPVVLGSGVTIANCCDYLAADGWIVGSWFKKGGLWTNELDEERVKSLLSKVERMSFSTGEIDSEQKRCVAANL